MGCLWKAELFHLTQDRERFRCMVTNINGHGTTRFDFHMNTRASLYSMTYAKEVLLNLTQALVETEKMVRGIYSQSTTKNAVWHKGTRIPLSTMGMPIHRYKRPKCIEMLEVLKAIANR